MISNVDNEYEALKESAREWWWRTGHGSDNRGSFQCQMLAGGGVFDISELLADFALQLPYQQEAAALSKPDAARLREIAQHLVDQIPYRKALDDHLRTCPGPPLILIKSCPHCGKDIA